MALHELYRPVAALMARVAADVVLPRYQNLAAHEISEKAADDYVTIADKESEQRLNEGLLEILPEAGLIGEEACAADPSILDDAGIGLKWIIDPVDGTGNFAAGHPPFGIIVALVDNGMPLAGWIFDPLSGRVCHAARGGGAFVDEGQVFATEANADRPVVALPVYFLSTEQQAAIAARAGDRFTLVDIPRCAAEQYPRLALGQNDIALFERSHAWDHAAGALFLNEAGGRLSRRDGSPYLVGGAPGGLIGASSPRMWDMAARYLL
ncbi:inositol monophosphatase family protein [Sphingobium aquiterrae]|uniref:inositol monophosphatase family protein n=1 Tax=Sphingobium aquiterrae TaxID=2038656 RepID=UPI003015EB0B